MEGTFDLANSAKPICSREMQYQGQLIDCAIVPVRSLVERDQQISNRSKRKGVNVDLNVSWGTDVTLCVTQHHDVT